MGSSLFPTFSIPLHSVSGQGGFHHLLPLAFWALLGGSFHPSILNFLPPLCYSFWARRAKSSWWNSLHCCCHCQQDRWARVGVGVSIGGMAQLLSMVAHVLSMVAQLLSMVRISSAQLWWKPGSWRKAQPIKLCVTEIWHLWMAGVLRTVMGITPLFPHVLILTILFHLLGCRLSLFYILYSWALCQSD